MGEEVREVEQLILLVGSNPLPNYLTACALRPSRLALVHTEQTKTVAELLQKELKRKLGDSVEFVTPCVEDASHVADIHDAISKLMTPNTSLNYTGGTKVMAAHARMAFAQNGGKCENASYLDEGGSSVGPMLRFDDGCVKRLDYNLVPLDLETILALHDQRLKPVQTAQIAPQERAAQEDAAVQIFRMISRWSDLLNNNRWLEILTDKWIREMGQPTQIGFDVFKGKTKAHFEIDVATIRGHRAYFVSCTKSKKKSDCKEKMFEIAIRSRQLGGDLARSALVCLADSKTVGELQEEFADIWTASNTPEVFGLCDIKAWLDKAPGQSRLKEWLEGKPCRS